MKIDNVMYNTVYFCIIYLKNIYRVLNFVYSALSLRSQNKSLVIYERPGLFSQVFRNSLLRPPSSPGSRSPRADPRG